MLTTDTMDAALALPIPRLARVVTDLECRAAEAADVLMGRLAGTDPDRYAAVIAAIAAGEGR